MLFSPFLLEDEFNTNESRAQISLGSASSTANSLSDLLDFYTESEKVRILKGLMDLKLDYSERFGALDLRRKLADSYATNGADINAEDIITTSGASEAIFLLFNTLFEAGDTIVVQDPIYQSLYQVALDTGVNVVNWEYDFTRDFDFNIENLKKIFTTNQRKRSKIKALVLNNPNNPTGIAFDKSQMNTIASLCEIFGQQRDLYLIVDEVFRELKWDEDQELSSALEVYDKAIVISDFSKAHGFPGLRLGWIAAKKFEMKKTAKKQDSKNSNELIEKLSSQKNYLSLRSNTISEYLASFILEKSNEIVDEKIQNIKENLEYLYSLDKDTLPFDLESVCSLKFDRGRSYITEQAHGGLCIFPKIRKGYKKFFNKANLEMMLEEYGLHIITGALFGASYKDHLRIGLGLEPEKFKAAMNILLLAAAQRSLVAA